MEEVEIKPESNLRLLKVFRTKEETIEVCKFLEENQIAYELTDSQPPLLLTTDTKKFQWWLLVPDDDIENAIGLLETLDQQKLGIIEKETYYLYEFSNDELWQVIECYDEWGNEDYNLAIKILGERGFEVNTEKQTELKLKRLEFLSQPEKGKTGWILFGWIMAVLGGIIAIFIGWHHKTFQKILPDGTKVLCYDNLTRKTGNNIFILGLVMTVVWIVVFIVLSLFN
jgi:hypothetical protein